MAASRFFLILFALLSTHIGAQQVRAESGVETTQKASIRPLSFQVVASGKQSGCVRPAKMLITNEAEWRRVWKIHDAKAELPSVDFTRQSVVALLSGEKGKSLEIEQIVHTPSEAVIYFSAKLEQTTARTQPFYFATVAKFAAPFRFVNSNPDECQTCVVR